MKNDSERCFYVINDMARPAGPDRALVNRTPAFSGFWPQPALVEAGGFDPSRGSLKTGDFKNVPKCSLRVSKSRQT